MLIRLMDIPICDFKYYPILFCINAVKFEFLQDWNDYDEKIKESVGIYEVTHKFIKC